MDVESLQSSGRRRSSCLDVFLVVSVVFLFVAVAAVAVCGMMFASKLQTELESPRNNAKKQIGDAGDAGDADSVYKMQNFVYLQPETSNLLTSTMKWKAVTSGAGKSIGSNYEFNPQQHSLKPTREGHYFMYINLSLTCTGICTPGLLSVQVGDKLTCDVVLPEGAVSTPVTKKCWTVSRLKGMEGLITQMVIPTDKLEKWNLDRNSSGFGMFLVD